MSAAKKRKTDRELVSELRQFHHYESARRLEELTLKDDKRFLERWAFVPGDQTMLLANAQADQAREGQRRRAIELPDDVFERLPLERQEQIYAMGRERK